MFARVATALIATAFLAMAAAPRPALAEEPCQGLLCTPSIPTRVQSCTVKVGTCDQGARCLVNVGYCETDGQCTVNVGHCEKGDETALMIDHELA